MARRLSGAERPENYPGPPNHRRGWDHDPWAVWRVTAVVVALLVLCTLGAAWAADVAEGFAAGVIP